MSIESVAAIAAVTRDFVIGRSGRLPWHYGEDLKRFKGLTLGGTIIMGRKTWQSLGEKPLPGRRNLVITRSRPDGVEYFSSIESALRRCSGAVWIVGGGEIYSASLHLCQFVDLTYVPDRIPVEGSVLFPALPCDDWIAGPEQIDAADARLVHQRFENRKSVDYL